MPKTPTKFGVKVWVNAKANTGYILNFQVCTGAVDEPSSKGHPHCDVIDLMEEFQGRGCKVLFDNFYTSAPPLKELLENGTWACGTIPQNRKDFPPALCVSEGSHLKAGEFQFATSGQITLVHWYNRRDVYVMSTMHGTTAELIEKRPKGSKEKRPIPCPTSIVDYNKFMGGVDLADQILTYYSLTKHRVLKRWKKFFWCMVDIAVLNFWIIFRENYPQSNTNSHKLFGICLIQQLVKPFLLARANPESPLAVGRQQHDISRWLLGKHFPCRGTKRGRCVVCSRQRMVAGSRKDTKIQTYCDKCICVSISASRTITHCLNTN